MPLDPEVTPEQVAGDLYDTPPKITGFDPEAVQPTSAPPSSDEPVAPDFGGTSGEDGETGEDPPQDGAEDSGEEQVEFNPKWREPFEGLLYIGALQDEFDLLGHHFIIRTLTTEELAEIALLVKPYEGSNMKVGMYQNAVVAASVVAVDGRPLPSPLGPGDSPLPFRSRWIAKNWYPAVRERIYERTYGLELTSRNVIEEMGKASG